MTNIHTLLLCHMYKIFLRNELFSVYNNTGQRWSSTLNQLAQHWLNKNHILHIRILRWPNTKTTFAQRWIIICERWANEQNDVGLTLAQRKLPTLAQCRLSAIWAVLPRPRLLSSTWNACNDASLPSFCSFSHCSPTLASAIDFRSDAILRLMRLFTSSWNCSFNFFGLLLHGPNIYNYISNIIYHNLWKCDVCKAHQLF